METLSRLLYVVPVLVLIVLRFRLVPGRRWLFAPLMALVVLAAALAWYGNRRALDGTYVPARLSSGHVVQGHAAP